MKLSATTHGSLTHGCSDAVMVKLVVHTYQGSGCCFRLCPHGEFRPHCVQCRQQRVRDVRGARRAAFRLARDEIARQSARLTDPVKYEMERMRALTRSAE